MQISSDLVVDHLLNTTPQKKIMVGQERQALQRRMLSKRIDVSSSTLVFYSQVLTKSVHQSPKQKMPQDMYKIDHSTRESSDCVKKLQKIVRSSIYWCHLPQYFVQTNLADVRTSHTIVGKITCSFAYNMEIRCHRETSHSMITASVHI